MNVLPFLLLLLSSSLVYLVHSAATNGVDHESEMMVFLRSRITKYTMPFDMLNNTVFIFFDLYQILNVDEKNGILQAKFWLYYYYYVPSASWDPDERANITNLIVPARTFWTPSIIVLDGVELDYQSFNDQIVYPIGLVGGWSSLLTMQVTCRYDVTKFPYDSQECPVAFGPWGVNNEEYKLGFDAFMNVSKEIDLEYFSDHEQWKLQRPLLSELSDRGLADMGTFDQLKVHLKLTRLPDFYIHVLLFPTVILDLLSPLTFLLPVESGEKMSLAITVLLAEVVTYEQLIAILPASSRTFPILGFFVITVVLQMSLACIFTAIVLSVHYVGGRHKMGHRLRVLITSRAMTLIGVQPCPREKALLPPISEERKYTSSSKLSTGVSRLFPAGKSSATVSPLFELKTTGDGTGSSQKNAGGKKESESDQQPGWERVKKAADLHSEENTEQLWHYFAAFLDRIFFFIYSIITVSALVYYFIQFQE